MGKVLLDGDIVAYRTAFATQDKTPQEAKQKTDEILDFIFSKTVEMPFPSTDDYHIYLTGSNNFRYEVAKSAPYKGNRKGEKPIHLQYVRDYLQDNFPCTTSEGEEADDLISIEATRIGPEAVIASIDKDFMQVPCWHYNFVKDEWRKVSEFEGLKFFYQQVLTGDAVDNIIGLYRVGPANASKILKGCTTEKELYRACVDAYGGDSDRVLENARLLWLRRYEGQMWEPPE